MKFSKKMNTFEVQVLHVLKFNLQILQSSYVIFFIYVLGLSECIRFICVKNEVQFVYKKSSLFIFGKVHHVCAMFSVLLFVCCGAEPPSK